MGVTRVVARSQQEAGVREKTRHFGTLRDDSNAPSLRSIHLKAELVPSASRVLFDRPKMTKGKFTALVMAGSRGPSDPVAQYCGVTHKALAPIAGRPMIEHVLDALAAAPSVGKIILVIEEPELLAALPAVQALGDRGE